MKLLAIEKENPGLTLSDYQPYLKDEAKKVLDFYLQGIVREIYFNERHEAVIILECDGMNEAAGYLESLPLVKAGLIHFELMELNPYTGFSRLLD